LLLLLYNGCNECVARSCHVAASSLLQIFALQAAKNVTLKCQLPQQIYAYIYIYIHINRAVYICALALPSSLHLQLTLGRIPKLPKHCIAISISCAPSKKVVAASFCGSCLPIVAFDKLLLMLTFKLSLLLLLLSYFVVVNYKNFPF